MITNRIFTHIANYYGSKSGLLKYIKATLFGYLGIFGNYGIVNSRVKRLVFVCKGNICRSALADIYCSRQNQIPVASFGLTTHSGKPANIRVREKSEKLGIDMSGHITTCYNDFEHQTGDMYICFEPDHCRQLQALGIKNDILLLGTLHNNKKWYIHDPYNANDHYVAYISTYIVEACDRLLSLVSEPEKPGFGTNQ
ncbi:arsenate reductase/protein-tyrosine-phosphatase family protein [Teredinibacter franksiae]|uniref:arsenate reductase/protein-tyrosine-phosphatase family protein n=1 Tax=Teredinibacter franksiae TaxID=2761453 RepID=UPI00162AA1F0|nr:hypothetical protein [Teredinibacter franksiae]